MAIYTFDSMDTMLDTCMYVYSFDCSYDVHSMGNHNNHHSVVHCNCNFCWYSFDLYCLCLFLCLCLCLCFAVCWLNFCGWMCWWCVLYSPMVRLCTVVKTEELLVFGFLFWFSLFFFHGQYKGNVMVLKVGRCGCVCVWTRTGARRVCIQLKIYENYLPIWLIWSRVFFVIEHTTSIYNTNQHTNYSHKHTILVHFYGQEVQLTMLFHRKTSKIL